MTSRYLERMTLFDPTYMMNMDDFLAISVKRLRIDIGTLYIQSSLNLLEYVLKWYYT